MIKTHPGILLGEIRRPLDVTSAHREGDITMHLQRPPKLYIIKERETHTLCAPGDLVTESLLSFLS